MATSSTVSAFSLIVLVGCGGAFRLQEEGSPAPGLEVRFEGRRSIGSGELLSVIKPDLRRYQREPNLGQLSDAAFRLEHYYRTEGFPFASIRVGLEGSTVRFDIHEGPRIYLGEVRFEGNQALSSEQLLDALPRFPRKTPYSTRLAKLQADALQAAYGRAGYVEARVGDPLTDYRPDEQRMDLTFPIREGPQYRLAGFENIPADLRPLLNRYLSQTYTSETADSIEGVVVNYYAERGHPFVLAHAAPSLDAASRTVTILLSIQAGPQARIGKISVQGNDETRTSFILTRADLDSGGYYQASDMRRAEERLMKTRLFQLVRVSPGPFDAETGTVPIDITVDEDKWGELAVRGGYGSVERAHVGVDVQYRNILGGGETGRVSGTISEIGIRADGGLAVPFVFGSEVQVAANGYYEDQDLPSFSIRSYGAAPSVSYPIGESYEFALGVRFAFVETSDISAGVSPGIEDFEYRALFFTGAWDRRDSAILPSRGFTLSGLTEYSGEPFESGVAYFKQTVRASAYVPLPFWKELIFVISTNVGLIEPLEDTAEIPISLRFFAGGTGSIRGFMEPLVGPVVNGEPEGGEALFTNQAELRFPIWRDLHGAIFSDQGNVWATDRDVTLDDLRVTAGVGLRYYTPAGAIVLDFGFNPDRRSGEDWYAVHLSIGFPF